MAFKLNISDKGKAWKLEMESEFLVGKNVGDKIEGKDINHDLDGYESEITGGSDIAGFPLSRAVEGLGLKKVLLRRGFSMMNTKRGLRLRKTVRGRQISSAVSQINIKVLKHGKKLLHEIFPDQNKPKSLKAQKVEAKVEEAIAA